MANETQEGAVLTRYLLGDVSEGERERLEGEYFTDDDAFERMLIAEEELIDAYVRGELPAQERDRFERRALASPRGRERVQFARDLSCAVAGLGSARLSSSPEAAPPSRQSFFSAARALGAGLRFALAAAAVLVVVAFSWLLVDRARTRRQLRQLREEQAALSERAQESERRAADERARNEGLLAQLENGQALPAPEGAPPPQDGEAGEAQPASDRDGKRAQTTGVAFFVLTPGHVRGGGEETLPVPRGASKIALRLNVEPGSFVRYHAVIETADKREVWRGEAIPVRRPLREGGTISLPRLPAKDLPPGYYVLLLSGVRPDGGSDGQPPYAFKIVRK